ncbi:Vacuolar iron transporter 1 [Sphaceloma murrayae]|uniref:Vacuolar iron transporter 1 n=1 Tax=Sphaceloma murrayae TaxID=2082308 RepID=A0A2K1QQI9_9PEZI|nr:Vacuolar iron transporter 1 [Sphaceloma murrayae]
MASPSGPPLSPIHHGPTTDSNSSSPAATSLGVDIPTSLRSSSVSTSATPTLSSLAESSSPNSRGRTLRDPVLLRDFIIGFSDGLTVPFALTAGLSSLGSSRLVILGGLAELFAGAISMGLGVILASVTERKRYQIMEASEWAKLDQSGDLAEAEEGHTGTGINNGRAVGDEHKTLHHGRRNSVDGGAAEPAPQITEEAESLTTGVHEKRSASKHPQVPSAAAALSRRPDKEVRGVFSDYGVRSQDIQDLAARLRSDESM